MLDFLGGSMGGRGGLGRGQRRVSPPSLGLARYSGLPGQGQEETLADWFLERAAHSAPVSPADRHMCVGIQGLGANLQAPA